MIEKYDIGIIGAGVAGAFSALRIAENYPSAKTIIFDLGRPPGKRRRQLEGWLGCFPSSDGKLYPGDLDSVLNIVDGRKARPANNWVMEKFAKANPMKLIKDTLPLVATQRKIKEAGYDIKTNNHVQWKPESIHQLSKIISDSIESNGSIKFNFDNEVYKIVKTNNTFVISTANGEFICKNIILAVGRSGWRWVTSLYKELGITVSDDIAQYGVRVEISAQHMKDFNKSHCSLSKNDLDIGPFSWHGTVMPEDHADLVISSFRSNEDRWKSDKVSFSVTSPKYFQNQGVYQADRLGKLAFLLFNDRVSKERIKLLLKNDSQLCLLPEYSWIKDSLIKLEDFIPNLVTRGYFYVPSIIPLPAKINLKSNLESDMDGLFVVGESSGVKGVVAAAIMGTIAADSICK
jgi:hypothetical protein